MSSTLPKRTGLAKEDCDQVAERTQGDQEVEAAGSSCFSEDALEEQSCCDLLCACEIFLGNYVRPSSVLCRTEWFVWWPPQTRLRTSSKVSNVCQIVQNRNDYERYESIPPNLLDRVLGKANVSACDTLAERRPRGALINTETRRPVQLTLTSLTILKACVYPP